MSFTHLHVHTEHSFLDGVPTLANLCERVLEIGQDSIAITDHGEGIIATGGCLGGCVATYLIESEIDKKTGEITPGKNYNPSFAEERISRLVDILDDRFYMELHTFPDPVQKQVNKLTVATANNLGVPMIAVSDSHYLRPDDWEDHELLIAAQMKMKWNDPKRYTYGEGALYVMSEDDIREKLTSHLPAGVVQQAIANTTLIKEMAEGTTIEVKHTTPVFLDTEKEDVNRLLRDAWDRFDKKAQRLGLDEDEYVEYRRQLQFELELVTKKGYAGYFLIVADVTRWAKDHAILIGPARGSAGGSLLSYVLGITEINPLQFGLLFERFLDETQTALPDIDVDVPQLERGLVLKYLADKYSVAAIGTLNTLAPKVLLNDFCRLLNIPGEDQAAISRLISQTPDLAALDFTWLEVRDMNAEGFAPWEKKYPRLFELMVAFAAHYRHASVHAAGTVVNKEPLMGRMPLRKKSDIITTQFPQEDVEEMGYMKMDFLGLRTLSTLMRAMELAGKGPLEFYEWQYDWAKYYEDMAVYQSLWEGRNVGVFQLDTEGFSRIIQRYKPESIEDMCATVSLFRPGVTRAMDPDTKLNLLEVFLQKREGRIPVTFRDDALRPILGNTYGSFLYQEQVMQACRDLADFTGPEQTKLRKILGKTMPAEMAKFKGLFIERATHKGIESETAELIWNDIESFGVYGFNKSHGLAYGEITYWTAWVKHHYPREFLTALFQTDEDNIKTYNRECRRLDVTLLGPDVNESEADFSLINDRIRYGIHGVKFVSNSSDAIKQMRPYTSVTDFMTKMVGTKVTKRSVEPLILVGALDSLVVAADRDEFLPTDWSDTKVALWRMYRAKMKLGKREAAALDEEGIYDKYAEDFEDYANSIHIDDRARAEVEYLGENVTTLPFGQWLPLITTAARVWQRDRGIPPFIGVARMMVNDEATLGGIIKDVHLFKVRKEGPNQGREMCNITVEHPVLEDGVVTDIDTQRIVVFPKEFSGVKSRLEIDAPVFLRVTRLKGDGGLCLNSVYRLDSNALRDRIGPEPVKELQEVGYYD